MAASGSLKVSFPAMARARARPCSKGRVCKFLQVKAQNFREEGRSSNAVDASMSVLRKRIDEVKMKERLERCCRCELGWNYSSEYNPRLRREREASELLQLVCVVLGTMGVTVITGTACLGFVSMLIHM